MQAQATQKIFSGDTRLKLYETSLQEIMVLLLLRNIQFHHKLQSKVLNVNVLCSDLGRCLNSNVGESDLKCPHLCSHFN